MKQFDFQKLLAAIPFLLTGAAGYAGINSSVNKPPLAPGHDDITFVLPEPGSYELPSLGTAADGRVVDAENNDLTLHSLMGDKIVILSFIYSTCSDVNGCPLATSVLHKIKNRLKKDLPLASQIRLITLSFNPKQDTPDKMKHYGSGFQSQGVAWHFLTTRSNRELQPILSQYKQNVQKVYDSEGRDTGTFSHVLRVYLIDRKKRVRNIYSVSFLHPDTLINDIKTVLLTDSTRPITDQSVKNIGGTVFTAGDVKADYGKKDYQTHSLALTDRKGKSADLLKFVKKPPLGLPPVPVPSNNPLSHEKIDLGRQLFYDRRLSLNNTFSCAMCHIPEQGFSSNEMATAVGIEGRTVRRNSPTLYNVGYFKTLFHDGRETTLEQQIWGPLLASNEMANPSVGFVIEKIKKNDDYNRRFHKVFGQEPNMETIGKAIASYERTLNSADSAFDRWYFAKDKKALSKTEQTGFKLFTGKAQCSSCHTVSKNYALFTDNDLHNTGIGYAEAMKSPNEKQQVQIAPGIYVDVEAKIIQSVSGPQSNDLGRYEVTQVPEDRWKYKTPTLRNIALTSPYMHNGSLATLNDVVEFYNRGGVDNENLDRLIKPLNLTDDEKEALTAFLFTLTGNNINDLVSDAFAAPVGDVVK